MIQLSDNGNGHELVLIKDSTKLEQDIGELAGASQAKNDWKNTIQRADTGMPYQCTLTKEMSKKAEKMMRVDKPKLAPKNLTVEMAASNNKDYRILTPEDTLDSNARIEIGSGADASNKSDFTAKDFSQTPKQSREKPKGSRRYTMLRMEDLVSKNPYKKQIRELPDEGLIELEALRAKYGMNETDEVADSKAGGVDLTPRRAQDLVDEC